MTSAADLARVEAFRREAALVEAFHREATAGGLAIVRVSPAEAYIKSPLQLGDTDASDVALGLSNYIKAMADELEGCRTALTLVAASIPCAEAHVVPKVRELVGRNGAYRRAVTNLEEVRAFAKDATASRVRGVLDVLKTSLAREARS